MNLKEYRLGDLTEVTRGANLASDYYAKEGKYKRITLGNFNYKEGGFKDDMQKEDIYYTGKVDERFILRKGDILTPLTEQALGLLGSTIRIPEDDKYIQSQDAALITCKEGLLDPDFCYYLISSAQVRNQLSAAAQQTKIRHTSPDKIKACKIFIPDLAEQKKIGQLLRRIEEKISLNKQINQNLEALAKQLYDYWFVQFDFPDENGKPYKSSGGKMVWNERLKREIPQGWEVKTINDLAEVFNGATPSTSDSLNYGGDIIWITPKDLSNQQSKFIIQGERNITDKGYGSCSTHLLPVDSILMSSRAPIGLFTIAKTELCTNQGFKSFVPKDKLLNSYLYYYLLQYKKQIERLGTGTTFKEVSRDDMLKFLVLTPNTNILHLFEEKAKAIGDEQLTIQNENSSLIKQRNELLPLLMNGQVNSDLSAY